MRKELLLLLALLGMGSAHAAPKCDTDTFTEEKSCVYGRGSIAVEASKPGLRVGRSPAY